MERDVVEILIPITLFVSTAAVAIFFIMARLKERKALIEKGLSGDDLRAFLENQKRKNSPYAIAKFAIIAIGVGLALLFGSFISGEMQEQVTFGMVLLFPGIGLFYLYMHIARKERENEE